VALFLEVEYLFLLKGSDKVVEEVLGLSALEVLPVEELEVLGLEVLGIGPGSQILVFGQVVLLLLVGRKGLR
jgi:hypothetical protein